MDSNQTNLTLEQALGILRRRAVWILACVALVAGTAYLFSKGQTPKYTATASLAFNSNQLSQQIAGLPTTNSANQQATNVRLVQLDEVAARAASRLGRGAALSVGAEGESSIVDVSATATSPALAAAFANTYAQAFVADQQSSNRPEYASALKRVNKKLAALSRKQRLSPAGLALQKTAQSLATALELPSGNVQVARVAAEPTAPSSPHVARNTILGGVLGLMLGLGIAFLLENGDRRIREPKDLEAIYGLPLLGVVPESDALARSAKAPRSKRGKKRARAALPPGEEEAFHLIRAHLRYFNVDREPRTLLVVSAAARDGKTTVARQLASATARMGSRVLLVEADLRHPAVAEQLDVQSGPGVSDVLLGAVSLSEATQVIDLDSVSADGSAERMLDVVVAGTVLPPNPGELMESHAMEALLEQANSAYDLVVIDTPPLVAVSDAFPLLRKVDGVIIVGRLGRNRRDVAGRLHETLKGAGAPLLGVVANGVKAGRRSSYGQAYGYEYAGAKRPPAPTVSVNGASVNGAVANGAEASAASHKADSADTAPANAATTNGASQPEQPALTAEDLRPGGVASPPPWEDGAFGEAVMPGPR
jgi:tyrosine-protein kinase